MKRDLESYLQHWKKTSDRKPILLKGARQVGKSYLINDFGREFAGFLEVNFEFNPEFKTIFEKDLDPSRIIRDLSIKTGKKIVPGNFLLFFDEIQECPDAITSMRYFYERMPDLHVIAAGSLIEFVLEDIGIPVGRIKSLYLYPMSFCEFLDATGNSLYREALIEHDISMEFSEVLHNELLRLIGEYMAVGGMPEAVSAWANSGDFFHCMEIHQTLIETYRQDFTKYSRKQQKKYVEMVFNSIPRLTGKKFVYSSISPDIRSRDLRPALELLVKAGVAHMVFHSSSNGLPLGAEINPSLYKTILLDIALSQAILGLDYGQWILEPVKSIVNLGAITESFVGQELLAYSPASQKKDLYYWIREKQGSKAEIDYIHSDKGNIIPIEVKSGTTGTLKSMHIFLDSKKHAPFGIQFSKQNFNQEKRIRQFPLYAIAKITAKMAV